MTSVPADGGLLNILDQHNLRLTAIQFADDSHVFFHGAFQQKQKRYETRYTLYKYFPIYLCELRVYSDQNRVAD